jgi:hypothetical protein
MYKGLLKRQILCNTGAKISRPASPIYFFAVYWIHSCSGPYLPTPSIDINHGTMQGDTLSPFLFTLFLEPFLR